MRSNLHIHNIFLHISRTVSLSSVDPINHSDMSWFMVGHSDHRRHHHYHHHQDEQWHQTCSEVPWLERMRRSRTSHAAWRAASLPICRTSSFMRVTRGWHEGGYDNDCDNDNHNPHPSPSVVRRHEGDNEGDMRVTMSLIEWGWHEGGYGDDCDNEYHKLNACHHEGDDGNGYVLWRY